jgi:hypothetical protein
MYIPLLILNSKTLTPHGSYPDITSNIQLVTPMLENAILQLESTMFQSALPRLTSVTLTVGVSIKAVFFFKNKRTRLLTGKSPIQQRGMSFRK